MRLELTRYSTCHVRAPIKWRFYKVVRVTSTSCDGPVKSDGFNRRFFDQRHIQLYIRFATLKNNSNLCLQLLPLF